MINFLIGPDGAPAFAAAVNGIPIYLDNFAVKCLAKGDAKLRERFAAVCHGGADLLFSIINAVELVGPQGASATAFKSFLNELGPHWFPLEMELQTVMDRESEGQDFGACCFCSELLKAYFKSRTSDDVAGSGRVIDLSADNFFKLGLFADWLLPRRNELRQKRAEFDTMLIEGVKNCRAKSKADQNWLKFALPVRPFDPRKPATFAYHHLMRNLINDRGDTLKQGDGNDFFHSVMASAYASFAALDQHWKRRIERLPKPNGLARIYYEPELPQMIADIEAALRQLKSQTRTAGVPF
jgi:hypothetical protein